MTEHHNFSNEDLTAYLDGEISPEVRRRIGSALTSDGNLRIRLETLTLDRATLKTAFEGLLQAAPAYPLKPAVTVKALPAPASNRLMFAAVAALCAVIGWGAATGLRQTTPPSWQEKAAIYHSLYVNGTITNINTDAANIQAELARVTTALGKDISLADLKRVAEFEYKRSQILGFEGRPLMQVAYLSRVGSPVVLCIMRSDATAALGVKTDVMQGMAAATWRKGTYEYLLIGGHDKALIERAANTFAAAL
jgi:anti-sigma factor RsiW